MNKKPETQLNNEFNRLNCKYMELNKKFSKTFDGSLF